MQPSLRDLRRQHTRHIHTSAFPLLTFGSSKCCRLIKLIHDALVSYCNVFSSFLLVFFKIHHFCNTFRLCCSLYIKPSCSIKAMTAHFMFYLAGQSSLPLYLSAPLPLIVHSSQSTVMLSMVLWTALYCEKSGYVHVSFILMSQM